MDAKSTITLIIGVITCIIGILSFGASKMKTAENEGRIAEKLDICLKSLDEMKDEMKVQTAAYNKQNVILEKQGQQLDYAFQRIKHIEEVINNG